MAKRDSFDERFDRLETLINAQGTRLDGRIDKVEGRFDKLDARITDETNKLGIRLDAVAHQVQVIAEDHGAKLDGLDARFTDESNKLGIRLDTVAHHVQVIAEGHGALAKDVAQMKGGIERLQAGQTNLGLRMLAVELRVTDVEKTQKIVLTEIRGLAARHS